MTPPDHLFKFLTVDGALGVLQSGALRFSAVERWGDPFELSSFSTLAFDANMLLEGAVNLAASMIFGPDDPRGDAPLINAITRWRHEKRFDSAEEAQTVLSELLGNMVDHRWSQLQATLHDWQTYCRTARYCCFCSRHDALSAWETYAHNHRGVALRFDVNTQAPWQNVRAMNYGADRPELTNLREQLAALLHNRNDQLVKRFPELHFTRASHRKPEQEWRAVVSAANPATGEQTDLTTWFEDRKFESSQLKAVYLGLATPNGERTKLTDYVAQHYPQAKIYQAIKGKAGFTLDFARAKQ